MMSVVEPEASKVEACMALMPVVGDDGASGDVDASKDEKAAQSSSLGPLIKRKASRTLHFAQHALELQPEWQRRVNRLANAIIRGAGAGFCLRGGINFVRSFTFRASTWEFIPYVFVHLCGARI
jgi:hypothetical protein